MSTSPSTTGCQASAAMPASGSSLMSGWAARICSTGNACSASNDPGRTSRTSSSRCATFAARSRVLTHTPGAALRDRFVEQAARRGNAEQCPDTVRARGLAEDRHVAGVAAEPGDAVADPFERRDLVEDARVARARGFGAELVGEVQEPERGQAVVDRDDHDVAVPGEVRSVVPRHRARARTRTRPRGSTPSPAAARRRTPVSTR